jgi:acyl transferase domain-containing protein/SAM-dependent methyltransferase/NADP-dependent 3-hydroxy acid dehydrogenase YdfG
MKNIAIVGLSCKFPGANSYQEFWQNLLQGVNSVKEIPIVRWNWQDFYGEPTQGENKTNSKWGGFIDGAELFDASFFGISPREAEQMDPQQRLALELAWQCIDNAGYVHEQLSGKDIGVFVGVSTFDYKELQEKNCPTIEGHSATGIHNTIVPNRISYFFNFFGPSIAIDSACAGSLVSIHQAINAINNGECEAALAGGVSILATPTTFIRFSKVGMLSPTGSCKTFDEEADGYARGEGGGFIFLKPLEKAIADKDNIWGVIKGSAVNHGGRARSITAPSALSQSKVISAALKDAEIHPSTIGFIEAHGTGTPLGDPIEILGLSRAFNAAAKKEGIQLENNYCAISAVKTNIGHLEAAAGVAGCIKTLLALKYKQIPGNSNFKTLNSRIKLEKTPFSILKESKTWNRLKDINGCEVPLRAGISSFGFGGVNCHIILEEAPATKINDAKPELSLAAKPYLLCLSAHSTTQLNNLKNSYIELLKSRSVLLPDLITTANTMQTTLRHREAFVGENENDLIELLSLKKSTLGVHPQEALKIGFMFTGQGSQYLGMGAELFNTLPPFRKYFMQCDALFEPFIGVSIYSLINSSNAEQLNKTEFSQPAIFTLEYALAKTLMDIGITPELMIGHSIGELVAACLAKVINLNDAVQIISDRARLMGSVNTSGGMLAIFEGSNKVSKFVAENGLKLDIAAINAPDNTVVSGHLEDLKKCKQLLDDNNIESKLLNVSQAFHSSLMEAVQPEFYEKISAIKFSAPEIPMISNVTGELFSEKDCNAHYWVDHIRKPVNFSGGIACATTHGINLWLEIGSATVLTALIKRHENLKLVNILHSLKQGTPELKNILNLIANLFTAGIPISLDKLEIFEKIGSKKSELPIRKFEGLPYWISPGNSSSSSPNNNARQTSNVKSLLSTSDCSEILLGRRLSIAGKEKNETYFFSEYNIDELGMLTDHKVMNKAVMPGAAFISMAFSAAKEVCIEAGAGKNIIISDVVFLRPLLIENTIGLQTVVKKNDDLETYTFEVWSSSCDIENNADGNIDNEISNDIKRTNPPSWNLNAKGVIQLTVIPGVTHHNFTEISRSESNAINADVFYSKISEIGFCYGPAFQGIISTSRLENKATAKIKLDSLNKEKFDFVKVRALDCIFQSALSLLPHDEKNHSISLPFEITKIEFTAEIPTECFVVTEITEAKNAFEFNLLMLNESNDVLGKITGLKLKTILKSAIFETNYNVAYDIDFCFTQQLLAVDIRDLVTANVDSASRKVGDRSGYTIIFCTRDSCALAIATKEVLNRDNVILVSADNSLATDPAIDFYVADYTQQNLGAAIHSSMLIDSIIYMGGYVKDSNILEAINNVEFIKNTKTLGINHFVQLCKSLIGFNLTDSEITLKVVTNKVMSAPRDNCLNPWGAPVVGAAKVFAKEYPLISLINIDVDDALSAKGCDHHSKYNSDQNKENAKHIVNISRPLNSAIEIAVRDNAIYQRSFHSVKFNDANQISLKPEGVYLILGGAGGIGFSLSKYLATHFNAKLVWLGRRSPNDEINKKIQQIESYGGNVLYIKTDASIPLEMQAAIELARQTYGKLNGVFHSALVLNDSSMNLLTEEKLNSVMTSKFEASINLFTSVSSMNPDFIAFFSSANSILANKGQANYVAASAFKDAFGLSLAKAQSIPIKIINWGYCGDVGVVSTKQYRDRLAAQGIESINESECVAIIKQSLSSPFTQIIPFKARNDVLTAIGFDSGVKECVAKNITQVTPDWKDEYKYNFKGFDYDLDLFFESHKFLDTFSAKLILKTFNLMLNNENFFAEESLKHILIADAAHEKFVISALHMLESEGLLQKSGNVIAFNFTSVTAVSWPDLQMEMNKMLSRYPWLEPELAITWQCGANLQKILSGGINSTEIIFPDMSMHLVEGVYKDGYLSQYFNAQTAEVVCSALKSISKSITSEKIIRILEVGAGTGSTSHVVLEKIKAFLQIFPELRVEYVYTDISNAFLQYGRLHYEETYPFVKFSLLDVGNHPATQDYEKTSFDIVIASNVLHATPALKETLENIKWLMKKDALIVLNELTQRKNYLTLTFGLLAGWWLSTDLKRRIENSPLLSPAAWNDLLTECGFAAFNDHRVDPTIEQCKYQSIISAQSNGHYFEKVLVSSALVPGSISTEVAEYPYVGTEDVCSIPHTASKPEIQELLIMYLRWQLVDVLKINIKSLFETRLNFKDMLLSELGMDSLTAMDLRNRFKKQLKIDVPVEILLGGGNVLAIVEHLYNQLLLQRLMSGNSTENKDHAANTEHNDENIEEFLI